MLSIRKATEADTELIRQLTFDIWPKAYGQILSAEQLDYMLERMYAPAELKRQMNNGQQYILCYDNDKIVGFAAYAKLDGSTYKLHKLYVLIEKHGKGAGKFLVNYVVNTVKELGAAILELNVNRYNYNAQGFYDKLGFVRVREEDIDIGRGYFMNDYILQLTL